MEGGSKLGFRGVGVVTPVLVEHVNVNSFRLFWFYQWRMVARLDQYKTYIYIYCKSSCWIGLSASNPRPREKTVFFQGDICISTSTIHCNHYTDSTVFDHVFELFEVKYDSMPWMVLFFLVVHQCCCEKVDSWFWDWSDEMDWKFIW